MSATCANALFVDKARVLVQFAQLAHFNWRAE